MALHQQTQARSPRDHQRSFRSTTAAPFHPFRDGRTEKLDQKPQELPPYLDKRRCLGERLQQEDLSSLPGPLQGHCPRSLRPHPSSSPLSVLCTHRRVGCCCLLFSLLIGLFLLPSTPQTSGVQTILQEASFRKMFMEHMRGRGLIREWLHCVDGKEGRKP